MRVAMIGSSSMGPRFIMGLLKRHGHTCSGVYQGIDTLVGREPCAGFSPAIPMGDLLALEPDVVGFSASSFDVAALLQQAARLKRERPRITVVFGGTHPTVAPEFVASHEQVDVTCVGEGEYPMADLCAALAGGSDHAGIPNLWVRKGVDVRRNALRPWVKDLDALPMDREGLSYLGIFSGRGCVGECTFCNAPTLKRMGAGGAYFRKRSVENVLDEVAHVVATEPVYAPRRADGPDATVPPLRFKDDTFLAHKPWFLAFARAYAERFPRLPYVCQARATEIDGDVADALASSGCSLVSIGIECGNEQFRTRILKKHVTNEQILRAARLVRDRGMRLLGQWILGFPGETMDLALETLAFHLRVGDVPQVHIATDFPGTPLRDLVTGPQSPDDLPTSDLYSEFKFHTGAERLLLRTLYNVFPIARLTLPTDHPHLAVLGTTSAYRSGRAIGEMLTLNMQPPPAGTDERPADGASPPPRAAGADESAFRSPTARKAARTPSCASFAPISRLTASSTTPTPRPATTCCSSTRGRSRTPSCEWSAPVARVRSSSIAWTARPGITAASTTPTTGRRR